VPASPLAGIAPVLGVFGVSLAVALSAGLLLTLFEGRRQKAEGRGRPISSFFLHPSAFFLLVLWLGGFALKQVEWTQPQGEPVKVSLLQGNIAQDLKWRPERALATLDAYLRLAQEAEGRLVILPETALALFLHEVPPEYLEALASRVKATGGDLLAGMPELTGPGEYYNSMVSFGASPTRVYRKHHLVPFGEFVPLRPLLGWVMDWLQIPLGDFSRGPALQAPLAVAGQKVAMNICYEDAFGEEIIRQLPEATLLANVTNDAWFGRSLGPQQHLQIAQARALETGRYLVRATNTGVTAFIDPRGRVLARAPEFTTTRLEAEATGYTGTTPYVRWGNWAVVLTSAAMILAALAAVGKGANG
jgi:apolipoprotein N-acyltransferase